MTVDKVSLAEPTTASPQSGLFPVAAKRGATQAVLSLFRKPAPPSGPVVVLSGTVGAARRYRCENLAEQLRLAGLDARVVELEHDDLQSARAIANAAIMHRVPWSPDVQQLIDSVHQRGGACWFNLDDLLFRPEHVSHLTFSGERAEHDAMEHRELAARYFRTLTACDQVLTSTETLAQEVRHATAKPVHVVRNAAAEETVRLSEHARGQQPLGGHACTLIGYLSGTPTHDRDLAEAIPGVTQLLRERPDVVVALVGFASASAFAEDVRVRLLHVPFQDWRLLPELMRRLDLVLAPLESDNRFTQCKSEVKYLESGLVGVPTIATATEAFATAIHDGKSGWLVGAGQRNECAGEAARRMRRSPPPRRGRQRCARRLPEALCPPAGACGRAGADRCARSSATRRNLHAVDLLAARLRGNSTAASLLVIAAAWLAFDVAAIARVTRHIDLAHYPFTFPDTWDWLMNAAYYAGRPVDCSWRPPLTALLQAAVLDHERLILLLSPLFFLLGAIAIAAAGAAVGVEAGAIAASLYLASHLYFGNALYVGNDLAASTLTFAALALAARPDCSPRRAALLGLTCGAAFLAGGVAVLAIGFALVVLAVRMRRASVRLLAVAAAALALALAPYYAFKWARIGSLAHSTVQHVEYLRVHLDAVPYYLAGQLCRFSPAVLALAVLGIASGWRGRPRWFTAYWLFAALLLAAFFALMYEWRDNRFLLYWGQPCVLLAAVGVTACMRRIKRPLARSIMHERDRARGVRLVSSRALPARPSSRECGSLPVGCSPTVGTGPTSRSRQARPASRRRPRRASRALPARHTTACPTMPCASPGSSASTRAAMTRSPCSPRTPSGPTCTAACSPTSPGGRSARSMHPTTSRAG
ncbi:MAG: glycosyltransferase [Planctomycetota bacterium]